MDSIRLCPTCGKVITERTAKGNFKRYCRPECSPSYGKRRPNHSAVMKKRAVEGRLGGLMKKGMHHNKGVNSVDFKLKCMKGSSWFDYDESQSLESNYSRYQSSKNLLTTTKIKRACNFFSKMDEDLRNLYLAVYALDSITLESAFSDKAYRLFWGLRTIHYNRRSPRASVTNFKATTIHNLSYNMSGARSMYVRSGYEARYVRLFERMHIPWEYEKITILSLSKAHHYTPDFYIEYGGNKYIIEVKGSMTFYTETEAKEYLEDKIAAAVDFCKNRGWHFILTFTAKPSSDMSFLLDEIV